MLIALLSIPLWYESILFSAVFVRVYSSELYRNILSTHALNIMIFALMLSLLLLKMCWSFRIALFASFFCLLMSSFVSIKLLRILHFFHSSGPFFVIVYSSVFCFVYFQTSFFQFRECDVFLLFCLVRVVCRCPSYVVCVLRSDGDAILGCYAVGVVS